MHEKGVEVSSSTGPDDAAPTAERSPTVDLLITMLAEPTASSMIRAQLRAWLGGWE